MYLQLAEKPRRTHVEGYRRKANKVKSHYRTLSDSEGESYYIYFPSNGMRIREDVLDCMNEAQWKELIMRLAPYQMEVQNGMSENVYLASKATRKAKREEKKDKKTKKSARKEEKKQTKVEKKKSKVEKRRAKSEAKVTRAQAKVTRAQAKKSGADSGEESGLDKIIGGAKNIFGMVTGGGGGGAPEGGDEDTTDNNAGGGASGNGKKKNKDEEATPFYKNPYVIGAGVLVLAGGIYALSKRKK